MVSRTNNQPTIRFVEYKKSNIGWEPNLLGELITNKSNKFNPKNDSENHPSIELEHIESNTGKLLGTAESSEQSSIKNRFEVGEVLYSKLRPYLNKYYYAKFNGVCSSEIWVLKSVSDKLINPFLYYLIQTSRYTELANKSSGSKMPRADWEIISDSEFRVPTVKEQQKIAEFFTLLDRRIEQQQEKVEAWREYKKGLMQRLFSRELRFKDEDGQEFSEWEDVKIDDIAASISYGMNAAAKEFDGENIYLRITDIDDESREYIEKGKVSPDGLLEEKYRLEKDDILFARTGASTGKSFLFKDEERLFYFAGFLIRVRLKEAVDANFVYQRTLTDSYRGWVKVMSMRSGQPGINGVEYGQFRFKLPCLKEQQKIGIVLSTIDKKIQYESSKVDLFNQQKQAFMQQMFI